MLKTFRENFKHLKWVLWLVIAVFVVFGKTPHRTEFFLAQDPEWVSVYVKARGNMSPDAQDVLVSQVERRLMGIKGVESLYVRTGSASSGGGPNAPPNDTIGRIQVEFFHYEDRKALGLRGKTLSDRYLARHFDDWRAWSLNPAHARWGGEAAAALLLGELMPNGRTPGVLTLYGDKLPARLLAEQGIEAAGPAAYEHLVELRKPFWGASLLAGDEAAATVPLALTYADLLATGNARCIEAAEMIYNMRLAGRFPPH
ncbi:MAG: hypothetical protein J5W83_16850 [Candidatus Accumulibacter sp.]|uniref:type IV toxin-antitoxin system AbiEi family antitoxin n=1 Tax=Accumulibacter sp. TaxID=2053492 RepID=UPI001B18E607|nr:type IV toxin-antitoxin system AbiEi family antitoxin [Accumulibacter sp.]MBO3704176.1 hypothetical protein [Accumulibacter sp.]